MLSGEPIACAVLVVPDILASCLRAVLMAGRAGFGLAIAYGKRPQVQWWPFMVARMSKLYPLYLAGVILGEGWHWCTRICARRPSQSICLAV
jgi:hypothetical protein